MSLPLGAAVARPKSGGGSEGKAAIPLVSPSSKTIQLPARRALRGVRECNDGERVHCACITPAIRCAGQVGVFGADLDGGQWARIADALPRSIALLQAPNHGGPPGRMARALLDDHLRPGVVVVTDAQPIVDDHLDWYAAGGRAAYTLQDRRTITVTMTAAGVEVDVGGLALPMA